MDPAEHNDISGTDRPANGGEARREAAFELPTKAEVEALVALGDQLPELSFDRAPPSAKPARRRRSYAARGLWERALDAIVVLVALASIAAAARPLLRNTAADAAQPTLTESIQELIAPAQPPPPAIEPEEITDPLARLGSRLRVAMGKYETLAGMYAQGRLPCAQLREAYVAVSDGWTAYSVALARHRQELSEGLAYQDEALYGSVQSVDADFTASGCNRP